MKCPFCRSNQTEVFNTRPTKFGSQLWRRRRCQTCHEAFTTYEAPDLGFIQISRQNASDEPYSRARLYAAVVGAFDNQTSSDAVDAITDTIESKLLDLRLRSIPASQIAKIVLATLKAFDTPAFLRYLASHTDLRSKTELKRQLKSYER